MAAHNNPGLDHTPLQLTAMRFLSPHQVADILNVSYATVTRLIKSGKLPAVKVGRILRVGQADLNTYIRINHQTPIG